MSDAFVGEIRAFAMPFLSYPIPRGWALCDGAAVSVAKKQLLFNVIGTAFGGDGIVTFNLPDLRGRVAEGPRASGDIVQPGEAGGSATVALAIDQMPAHTHAAIGGSKPPTAVATDATWGITEPAPSQALPYAAPTAPVKAMRPDAVGYAGSGGGHPNIQPSAVIAYLICVDGLYPVPGDE